MTSEEASKKRIRRKVGDIVRVDLEGGRHAYAQVARAPLFIFFDGTFSESIPIEKIPYLPVAFKIWVSDYAVTKGIWPVIGNQDLVPGNVPMPLFRKQDGRTGRLSLYSSDWPETNNERPATFTECEGLEYAAVWDPEHVVERLNDHAAGRPNEWVTRFAIKP